MLWGSMRNITSRSTTWRSCLGPTIPWPNISEKLWIGLKRAGIESLITQFLVERTGQIHQKTTETHLADRKHIFHSTHPTIVLSSFLPADTTSTLLPHLSWKYLVIWRRLSQPNSLQHKLGVNQTLNHGAKTVPPREEGTDLSTSETKQSLHRHVDQHRSDKYSWGFSLHLTLKDEGHSSEDTNVHVWTREERWSERGVTATSMLNTCPWILS